MKHSALFESFQSFSRRLAGFQAVVVLSLVYWLVVSWMAGLWRLFGKKSVSADWSRWSIPSDSLDDLRRQY